MSRYNPHFPHANDVFEAAQQFAKRCLIEQSSLLLPDQNLWTTPHFESLKTHFVDQPDLTKRTFYEKLADQLATCEPLDVALMTEIFWIVELAPNNLLPATKVAKMKVIWGIKPAAPFPEQSTFLREDVLGGLGSGGAGFTQYLPYEIAFAVEAFGDLARRPLAERQSLLSDGVQFAKWFDGIPAGNGRQLYHALCHVLFPDTFERIFSHTHKKKLARHYDIWNTTVAASRPALDAALLTLRERLETQYPGVVDYYEPPVGTLRAQNDPPEAAQSPNAELTAQELISLPNSGRSSAATDSTDNASPVRRTADNLILFGPPGTGKTFELERRMRVAFENGEECLFVAFHPSYSYEDFMGGFRPSPSQDGRGLAIAFQKGPFLTLCEKAHNNPTERFTLFIDEINRANVAKVFGELITLVEPSKRVIAGSKPNDDGLWVTLPYTKERFGVPDNINIVATMNTADRSIAMMDIALRRRFRFQECPPEPKLISPANVGTVHLPALLQVINDRLEYLLDRDHLIGHAMLMDIQNLAQLQHVLAERIIPLLQEYFFEDAERVRLALTGGTKGTAFFATRKLSPEVLFPKGKHDIGTEFRTSLEITDSTKWSETDIRGLYETASIGLDNPASDGDQSGVSLPPDEIEDKT